MLDGYQPDPTEQRVINQWYPEKHPVHCSNCAHSQVYVFRDKLMLRCRLGYGDKGKGRPYSVVMRLTRPMSFKVASICPDWSSMDDSE